MFTSIKNFLGTGHMLITPARNNGQPTVVLDIMNIEALMNIIIPLFDSSNGFFSKKGLDYSDWCNLGALAIKMYYLGYHTDPQGLALFKEIKSSVNNFRLTTNPNNVYLDNKLLQEKVFNLFANPAPYKFRNDIRLLENGSVLRPGKDK